MQNPTEEFPDIIRLLVLGKDGNEIKQTIDRVYTPDTAFTHPLAKFKGGPGSRETLKNVWAVYKVACWGISYTLNDLHYDERQDKIIANLTYNTLGIGPLLVCDVPFLSVFQLEKSPADGLYRIAEHWDCYPLDGIARWKVWGVPVGLPYEVYLRVAAVSGRVVGGLCRKIGLF